MFGKGRVGRYDKELLGDYQSMTDNGMPIGGFDWPADGKIKLEGLNNKTIKAYPLENPPDKLVIEKSKNGIQITLPSE